MDLDRHQETDVVCDALHLPFRDHVFAEINANQIMEHLYAPFHSLLEWKRVLQPSGFMTLCVPNILYYRRIIRYLLNKPITQNPDHIQCFTISELMNMMRLAHMTILSVEYLTEIWRHENASRFQQFLKYLTNKHLRLTIERERK